MARKQSWNAPKLNAELSAADEAINPLLESANISTIKLNGVDEPAGKAPLSDRIQAYAAVVKAGVVDKDDVDLATLNTQITAQLEKSEAALAVAQSSLASITQEKSTLTTELSTAKANVSKLTAENAQLVELRSAATKQAGQAVSERNALNSEISRQALIFGCLTDLKDVDGKLLASTATAIEREAAADLIPAADKLKSISGAVNLAVSRLGVSTKEIPSAPAGNANAKAETKLTGLERADAAHKAKQAAK